MTVRNNLSNMVRWVAVGAVAASALGGAVASSATSAPAQRTVTTNYGLQSFAYGSRVLSSDQVINSGKSAFTYVACTSQAGVSRVNQVLGVDLPTGIADIHGVRSHSWTTAHQGKVSSWSTNRIASVRLANVLGVGTLRLTGIVAKSHVWHDAQGYHAEGSTSLAGITLTALGVTTPVPVPNPGQTVDLAGLGIATITLANSGLTHTGSYATANSNVLVLNILATHTKINLGHAFARIDANPNHGLFQGSAYSSRLTLLDGTLKSGPTSLLVLPCVGTHGQTVTSNTAGVGVPDVATLEGLHSAVRGVSHSNGSAVGVTSNSIAKVQLGDLVIRGIRGVAHVTRTAGGKWLKSARGTRILSIKLNGAPLALPTPGNPLTVPGIAVIRFRDVTKGKYGLAVNALKLTLLGSDQGATLVLGHAETRILPK